MNRNWRGGSHGSDVMAGIASDAGAVLAVSVDSLFHRDLGGAGNPPLVVLHGLLGSSRNWLTTGGDLAARYHVLALDLRNHGKSPHGAEMDYPTMMADVLAWMDAQGLGKVALMGHSMGGKVAMLLACRHPERVERLIIVDIAPRDYLSHAHRAEFAAMNELRLDTLQSRGEAELRFEARVADWAMRKFLTTNLERTEAGAWKWQINLPVITTALPELEGNPLVSEDKFDGPVLFVTGGKSHYVREEDLSVITAHFPKVKVRTVAGSGHNPHMETRAEFVRLVMADA
ncbi:MAG: alpha/beta fold hydrolase [Opitutaceae bacterium]|jgi:pimeloyl-ACP methyl ester carboxylesterase